MKNENIRYRLTNALASKGVKQKELAAHLKVKDNVISYFCGGVRTPNAQQIIEIAKFLNVSTDYLLGLSNVMSRNEDMQIAVKTTGLSEAAIEKTKKYPYLCNAIEELLENASFIKKLLRIQKIVEKLGTDQ